MTTYSSSDEKKRTRPRNALRVRPAEFRRNRFRRCSRRTTPQAAAHPRRRRSDTTPRAARPGKPGGRARCRTRDSAAPGLGMSQTHRECVGMRIPAASGRTSAAALPTASPPLPLEQGKKRPKSVRDPLRRLRQGNLSPEKDFPEKNHRSSFPPGNRLIQIMPPRCAVSASATRTASVRPPRKGTPNTVSRRAGSVLKRHAAIAHYNC